jgi:hypothetical protein
VPCLGHELECRKDVVSVLAQVTQYSKKVFEDRPLTHFLFERKTVTVPKGYAFSTLAPTPELKFILIKLNTKNPQNLVNCIGQPVENVISYVYELYKQHIDNHNSCLSAPHLKLKRNNAIYNRMTVNGVPEYILKDAQQKATKTSRPWLILSAVRFMSEMTQWWYDYVDKYALEWMFLPPPDLPKFHEKLVMSYGNMQYIKIIPSRGIKTLED